MITIKPDARAFFDEVVRTEGYEEIMKKGIVAKYSAYYGECLVTKGQIYYYYGKDWPMFSMALVRFTDKYENKDDYYFWLVPGLDSFSCSHKGPYGDIVSSWKRENGMIRYDVTIPPNSTATLRLNARVQQLTAGTHTFTGDFFKARIDHEK